jgi:glucosamine--fructose-6-phosphate aminotransferase (isomerizing)
MWGIVASAALKAASPVLITGLESLEYRGYDSAGLALLDATGDMTRFRYAGRVAGLAELLTGHTLNHTVGIAHTRWATHGIPSERNAHPHLSDKSGLQVCVVHNGIIENHAAYRQQLQQHGYVFTSDTDTEVIVHALHHHLSTTNDTLLQAVFAVRQQLHGMYAIAAICSRNPAEIVVARQGAPLVIGIGGDDASGKNQGYFAASDVAALITHTKQFIYLEDGDVAAFTAQQLRLYDAANQPLNTSDGKPQRPIIHSKLSADAIDLAGYQHFMQKEIFEQPAAVARTIQNIPLTQFDATLFGESAPAVFKATQHILILACGTSFHAGLVAKYWLESIAKVAVSVEIASEFRYRDSVIAPNTLVVAISQSGETADTLAAVKHIQNTHPQANAVLSTLSICNVPESALLRTAQLHFLTQAGPEIGVASTKAFVTQLVALFVLTLGIAHSKDILPTDVLQAHLQDLRHLPLAMDHVLAQEPQIKTWVPAFYDKQHALFLGRGIHYPIGMEGALKLKEISYIHAEAYAAGELKHGPLALVDQHMPVVIVAPNDELLDKLKSNMQEVAARGGQLFVFADQGTGCEDDAQTTTGVQVITLRDYAGALSPILHVIPLQLLSYHIAVSRGTDVDKPRNLAKSVTVE